MQGGLGRKNQEGLRRKDRLHNGERYLVAVIIFTRDHGMLMSVYHYLHFTEETEQWR